MTHDDVAREIDSFGFSSRQRAVVLGLVAEYHALLARVEDVEEDLIVDDVPKVRIYREAAALRKLWPIDRCPLDAVPEPCRPKQRPPARIPREDFERAWRAGGTQAERARTLGITRQQASRLARQYGLI